MLFGHFVNIGWKYVEILKDSYQINVVRTKSLILFVAFLMVAERIHNILVYSVKRLCLDWKIQEPIWIDPLCNYSKFAMMANPCIATVFYDSLIMFLCDFKNHEQ